MKLMKLLMILATGLGCSVSAKQPVEVGTVNWSRDHDAVLKESKASGIPVFLLFQEVPGCAGCKDFGREVLSDPELVRLIEQSFLPLLVYNNRSGKDSKLLKQYNEPSWNYQVVRFLDGDGNDIIPRKDRVWTKPALLQRMQQVLDKTGNPALSRTLTTSQYKEAAISQYCFWTGEMVIGGIDGVVETEAGFLNGQEVTRVIYDPSLVSLEEIHKAAASRNCGDRTYTSLDGYRKAPEHDQKRQIRGTHFEAVLMSNAQATKVNAWVRKNPRKAIEFLSPEQREQLAN